MRIFRLIAMALILASPAAAEAHGKGPTEVWLFSSMCTERESGDVAGYAISLRPFARPPAASFGWTEGAAMAPVATTEVRLDRRSGALQFQADAGGRTLSFAGWTSGSALVGTITWSGDKDALHRQEQVRLTRTAGLRRRPPCPARH